MGYLLLIPLTVLLFGVLAKIYVRLTTGRCKSRICLVGKTVVVTGANIGIGYATALDFASRGAKVILACRNERKAEEARARIVEETANQNLHVRLVDFASFKSVRAFAKTINETEDRLDILVNNAGAIGLDDERTEDGHQILIQVNYYSSFLLTNLLIRLLKKSSPSRIVNVASWAATRATEFDLNTFDDYVSTLTNYGNSKFCNVLFTMELARKLQGTGVTTYSLNPGLVRTNIFHNFTGIVSLAFAIQVYLYGRTCEEGAQTILHCALAKGIEDDSGSYFAECKNDNFGLMTRDPELPGKLWERPKILSV